MHSQHHLTWIDGPAGRLQTIYLPAKGQAQGVAVLISLRCGDGRLLPIASHRLPGADDLTPVTARIALMLNLMQREAG